MNNYNIPLHGRPLVHPVSPYTSEPETNIILSVMSMFPFPYVLETGTAEGMTTANIGEVARVLKGKVWTVDVLQHPETLPVGQKGEVKPDLSGSKIPSDLIEDGVVISAMLPTGTSEELSAFLSSNSGCSQKTLDVVFIDGNHSEAGIQSDVDAVMPFLSDNGIILFHDVWWDVEPAPVQGVLDYLDKTGMVTINMTHIGIMQCHLERLNKLFCGNCPKQGGQS